MEQRGEGRVRERKRGLVGRQGRWREECDGARWRRGQGGRVMMCGWSSEQDESR